jgi:hypothetical protein
MNIRRGLIRIWVVLTVLQLIPLGIAIHQEWLRANELHEVEIKGHRFQISKPAFDQLLEGERNQVLARIAWLNGLEENQPDPSADYELLPEDKPLLPKLESLARGEFIRPDLLSFLWGLEWLLPLAVVIPVLWIALYVGFWIASGFQSRPAR